MSTPKSLDGLLNLLAFVKIVEAGSFAEAARRAGTTTSAMSKAVTRFEQSHGIRLLHRTTHALSMTPEGERLLEGARDLMRGAERLEASLGESGQHGAYGRVRISLPGALARACVVPILPRLQAEHPGIDIELGFDHTSLDLGAEDIDIALRSGRIEDQSGLVARTLTTFPWVLCASPAYLALRGIPTSPTDLSGHEQIGFRNAGTGQLQPWIFADPKRKPALSTIRHVPPSRLVVDGGTTAWTMVLAGMGLAWVPSWLGREDLRQGRAIEVLRDWRIPETRLSAVRLDKDLTPKRTQIVLDILAAAAPGWRGEG
ncbi:LysR family transcriptional regulator [Lichenihabitans sp. PAMC28606]|uniref:LysR family transcriptional regulator n=1 Tax=Lichenihabitans sp. PAMC28606 TaxID=2880932 RepID=UPI001D0AF0C5|nr:LysR family transcriptional regulator [Lichenihabitans sp. PAMC28606]UDL93544.1 LysR family transcriptional regulator [Lichenihabitans sp. PAMC28606]